MNVLTLIMLTGHLWLPRAHVHFHPFHPLVPGIVVVENHPYAIEEVPREKDDEETLLSSPITIGAYGAFTMKFDRLNGDFAYLLGGRGGLVFNRAFVIGGGGYGLTNDILVNVQLPSGQYHMDFGYGGFFMEYILASRKLAHLSFNALIGGGDIRLHDEFYYFEYEDDFFVFEPGAELELNFTPHFRIGAGGSYRYIAGADLAGINSHDLSGPSINLNFKFGHY
jgi:hypothetical protein